MNTGPVSLYRQCQGKDQRRGYESFVFIEQQKQGKQGKGQRGALKHERRQVCNVAGVHGAVNKDGPHRKVEELR